MQMLTLRNIHWTIDLLWSWGLWCCWSTNHKSYCGGMWTWRTPQQCWLRGRQVHLGHRLGVLASLLVNIALKLHSEESKYTSASPRSTCFPPRATSTQVPLVQVQVHLGCASVNLALDSGDLSGVSGWAPRATSAQVPLVKSKFTSAAPRWTWPWLGELERSPPSSHPPTVGLILNLHTFYRTNIRYGAGFTWFLTRECKSTLERTQIGFWLMYGPSSPPILTSPLSPLSQSSMSGLSSK